MCDLLTCGVCLSSCSANQSAASAQQPSADLGIVHPSPPAASHREPGHHAPVPAVAEREAAQPEAEERQQQDGDDEVDSGTVNDDEATMQHGQEVEKAGEPVIAQAASSPAVAPLSQTTGRETTGVTAGAPEAPADDGAPADDCPPTLPDMTQPAPLIAPRVVRPPPAPPPCPAALSLSYRLCDGPGLKRKRKRAGLAEQQQEKHTDGEDVGAAGALHLLGRGEREGEGEWGEGGEGHDDGGGDHGASPSFGGGCTATVPDTDTFVPQPRQPRIIEDQQSDHHHPHHHHQQQQQEEEVANGEAAVEEADFVGGAEGAEPSAVVGVLEHTASADASVPIARVVELREGTFVIGRQRDKVDLHLDSTYVSCRGREGRKQLSV